MIDTTKRPEITLIAHNIRSTHNVGAIFRTAEGFGVSRIILSGYTPYPAQPQKPTLPPSDVSRFNLDTAPIDESHDIMTQNTRARVRPLHDERLPHEVEKLTQQIHKTALGAEAMVPFDYCASLDEWLHDNAASAEPLPVLALEQASNSVNLRDFTPPRRFALLLGEEVHGIEPGYLDHCNTILEIPMVGQKESFNVSVATGIALYGLAANGN